MPETTTNSNNSTIAAVDQKQQQRRILCLHGWMDNCRSFYYLAPWLMQRLPPGSELVALDFPGHGWSSHKSIDAPPTLLAETAFYVAEAVRLLQWDIASDENNSIPSDQTKGQTSTSTTPTADSTNTTTTTTRTVINTNWLCPRTFILMGHSMGAAVSCLYAAAFPEQIERLVLLEGAGPLARNTSHVAQHVRHHVQRRQRQLRQEQQQQQHTNNTNSSKQPRLYPSLTKAVEARCATARNFPGDQWISVEAAQELVVRGTFLGSSSSSGVISSSSSNSSADQTSLQFRHDPRLHWPSIQYFTSEQTEALYAAIHAAKIPTALFLAKEGWPFDEVAFDKMMTLLQPTKYTQLEGSHHLHADPETAEALAMHVLAFLLNQRDDDDAPLATKSAAATNPVV
jgi:pimeloyl-ACP methyl ester carboxylesterase